MKKHCLTINRRLLPIKVHYFLFYLALACAMPFRAIFAKQLGFSATAVGLIFGAVPFMTIFTNPLFGFLLDYFKRLHLTLLVIMIFVAVSHIAMVFVPSKTLMPVDKMNYTGKDIFSKVMHLYANDSLQPSCHLDLTLYIDHRISQRFIGINYTCHMQCSNTQKNFLLFSIKDESQCHIEMTFKVLFHISESDIDSRLEEGQLILVEAGTQNLLRFEIINSVCRKNALPSKNCSIEQTESLTLASKSAQERREKLRQQTQEVNISDVSGFVKRYMKNESLDSDVLTTQCYVQNECIINFSNETLCLSSSCNHEFDCQVINCSFVNKRNENNSEQFSVENHDFYSFQFWTFFMLMAVSCATSNAIIFMMDTFCYELLKEKKDKYGQQRLWGAVGWGLGGLIGGCLNQVMSHGSIEIDYASSFYLLGVLSLTSLIPLYFLKAADHKYSSNICKDVYVLVTTIRIAYNIFIVYIVGILSGLFWNYQFWFMEEIGASQMLLGLSLTFDSLFEVLFFFVSGWIAKYLGHGHCTSITLLCFGLRYSCFAIMYDPWWTLPAGFLLGPTFGLFYASMTMYAKNEAPAGTEATVQSLLQLFFSGLGISTGNLLGGIGVDKYGSRMCFIHAAETSFIFLLANIVVSIYLSKTHKAKKEITVSILSGNIVTS